jgi:hypothetical protein
VQAATRRFKTLSITSSSVKQNEAALSVTHLQQRHEGGAEEEETRLKHVPGPA